MSDPNLRMQQQIKALDDTLERLRKADTGIPSGASFPASPTTNFKFFRTDLGHLCYYDGARWLTENEFVSDFTPYARNPMPHAGGAAVLLLAPLRTDGANIAVMRAKVYLDVATTNNGANFWTIALKNAAGTTYWSFDTSADGAGVGINKEFSTAAVYADPAYMTAEVTAKTGAPGTLQLNAVFWYRIEFA